MVVAVCADRTLRTWRVGEADESSRTNLSRELLGLVASDDGQRVVTVAETLFLVEPGLGREQEPFPAVTSKLAGAAASPGSNQVLASTVDGTVRVLRLPKPGGEAEETFRTSTDTASTDLAPDDVNWGRVVRVEGHPSVVSDLAVSPDAARVASVSISDRKIKLWDANGEPLNALQTAGSGLVRVGFGPSVVIAGKQDGEFLEWDLATGKESKWTQKLDAGVTSVAVSPDAGWLVAASADTRKGIASVARLDTETGQPILVGVACGPTGGDRSSCPVTARRSWRSWTVP